MIFVADKVMKEIKQRVTATLIGSVLSIENS